MRNNPMARGLSAALPLSVHIKKSLLFKFLDRPPFISRFANTLANNFRIRNVLIVAGIVLAFVSLGISDSLVEKLAQEERAKMELWAQASSVAGTDEPQLFYALIYRIIESNTSIPLILTSQEGQILTYRNIKLPRKNPEKFLYKKLNNYRKGYRPIRIDQVNGEVSYLYYSDSHTLTKLLVYPYIQLGAFFLFVLIAILALLTSKRSEQNRIWEGLSRETAHQLGTPISSLMAWNELLKSSDTDPVIVQEIDKDITRLSIIADRFQKVGSEPAKTTEELGKVLQRSTDYLRVRISQQVKVDLTLYPEPVFVNISESLISWVLENLMKNAVDAMQGSGSISIKYTPRNKTVNIDVTDTGKGISRRKVRTIFEPGYTTRKRGWGLGLSLAWRIVEDYHNGRIFVKQTEIGIGTTFRIVLPLAGPADDTHERDTQEFEALQNKISD